MNLAAEARRQARPFGQENPCPKAVAEKSRRWRDGGYVP
jgi:hypothetical protein